MSAELSKTVETLNALGPRGQFDSPVALAARNIIGPGNEILLRGKQLCQDLAALFGLATQDAHAATLLTALLASTGAGVSLAATLPDTGLSVLRTAVATFDPSATAGERTVAAHGLGVTIPDNAIIVGALVEVLTTFTSTDDSATVALHVQGADDLIAAVAISDAANPWDAGLKGTKVGYPNLGADSAHDSAAEVAALFVGTMIKLTAAREITATVAVQALTAGKARIFVHYLQGG